MKYSLRNLDKFEELRVILTKDRTHSPFVVEFTGMPKSGKTTIIDRVANILESQKLKVHVVKEAASEKVESRYRSDLFIFNMLCALENLRNLLLVGAMKGDYDVVLMDRGVYDSLVWCEFLSRSGLMSDSAKTKLENFFSLGQWTSKIDMVANIKVDRKTYEARSSVNWPIDQDSRFNEEYFKILDLAYDEVRRIVCCGNSALTPRYLDYDTSVSLGMLNSDDHVLSESNVCFSKFSVQIAEYIVEDMIEKSIERIAVVDSESFEPVVDITISDKYVQFLAQQLFGRKTEGYYDSRFDPGFKPKVQYMERSKAEIDQNYVQIVAAAYISNKNRYLVFTRSESEKREQLRGKKTLIVSGHVDYEDQALSHGGNNEIENCLLRELAEELQYFDRPMIEPKFAFRMGDDVMGKRHYSFVYHVSTNSNRVEAIGLPGTGDFKPEATWMTLSQLQEFHNEFDPWSRVVIGRLVG